MAQYQLTQDAFLEPDLRKGGSVVEFDGPPGPHMLPLDDEARARVAEMDAAAMRQVAMPAIQPAAIKEVQKAASSRLVKAPPKPEDIGMSLAEAASQGLAP